MANRLNISQKQYSRLESGETQLKILHLEEISQELGVGIDYFFSPSIQQENNHQSGGIANIAETIVNHQSSDVLEQIIKNQEKTLQILQKALVEKA